MGGGGSTGENLSWRASREPGNMRERMSGGSGSGGDSLSGTVLFGKNKGKNHGTHYWPTDKKRGLLLRES